MTIIPRVASSWPAWGWAPPARCCALDRRPAGRRGDGAGGGRPSSSACSCSPAPTACSSGSPPAKARGERDFDLGPIYQPVAAYKDRMTIVHALLHPAHQGPARQPHVADHGAWPRPARTPNPRPARRHLHRSLHRQEDRGRRRLLVDHGRPGRFAQRRRAGPAAARSSPRPRRRSPRTSAGRCRHPAAGGPAPAAGSSATSSPRTRASSTGCAPTSAG